MAASEEQIQAILKEVAGELRPMIDPLVESMFQFGPRPPGDGPISMHKWVLGPIHHTDSPETIKMVAKMAILEMNTAPTRIATDVLLGRQQILHTLPLWIDGDQLFDRKAPIDGGRRFGVEGGNIVESVDCFASDITNAVDRLTQLDPNGAYDSDNRLMIYCARPLVKRLIQASVRAHQPCKVMGVKDIQDESWALFSNKAPCHMEIRRPDFVLPPNGARIFVGAKISVWLSDPRRAVLVRPRVGE